MALITPEGRYVRIPKEYVRSILGNVHLETYKDAITRTNVNEFDRVVNTEEALVIDDALVNTVLASLYTNLKTTETYSTCIDG